ncbi:MAG TPA: SusD/RagB family nutrient-binding outer membrane lipoprotein [Chitinophagaceae bacterium]|jgi:hypothetical protein|nr:SusD/RagB family nutrient-binding outer membrane lipoprotein [Chitinophagaceae bacterium]
MKKIFVSIISATVLLVSGTGCKKYLDVNSDPNNPTDVEAALLLSPILQNFSHGSAIDNRYIGRYVQQWHYGATTGDQWDQHGYTRNNDRAAAMFRSVYWRGGYNLINMISEAKTNEKWDYVGVGYALKAYGWQTLTDMHGEIIVSEAFTPGQTAFTYDTQEQVYMEVRKLCDTALFYLNKVDGKVSEASLKRGDQVFKGVRERWIKFVYGILARNYNHLSKKGSLYKPDSVIYFADKAMASNADDAMTPCDGASAAADASPYGQSRATISGEEGFHAMGQSWYAIVLMDSTNFGSPTKVTDPRMAVMLMPSPDGVYRGLNPAKGVTEISVVAQRVPNLYGLTMNTAPTLTQTGLKYLWRNEAPVPMMTYAEMQFIKAEASLKLGLNQQALDAYKNGVSASIDFVGMMPGYVKLAYTPGTGTSVITPAQKTAYMNNTFVVPTDPANITLAKIMMQKWIAMYGWGAHEVWADMRRHDYSNTVYLNFKIPNPLFTDNNSKVVQRTRMRYNSEYIWNTVALQAIGGLDVDFHTKPTWIAMP